jgi:hypothetical protein
MCLGRSPSTLLVVATEARSDDVFPGLLSTARDRNDVVEAEVFGRKALTAVLAFVIVPHVDVRTRKFDAGSVPDSNVLDQPADGRELDRKRDTVKFFIVLVEDLDLARKQKRQGLPPRNNAERFIGCVQQQRGLHVLIILPVFESLLAHRRPCQGVLTQNLFVAERLPRGFAGYSDEDPKADTMAVS